MITKEINKSLKSFNTFGIDVTAASYLNITNLQELKEALAQYKDRKVFLLGGGSNMLLLSNISIPVLHLNIFGKQVVDQSGNQILYKVMAGENWHQTVMECVNKGWAGLENMALIPGNVGTAPIQNIGAYGVELKDVFHSCEVMNIQDQSVRVLTSEDCNFGYRDSVFKNEYAGMFVITSVTFKLTDISLSNSYKLKTSYGAIQTELEKMGDSPSIKSIAQAVINIRSSKLPDPKILGNSGSFFKNPIIPIQKYQQLKERFANMPHYPVDELHVKVPAGWLIDQCGFKGYKKGDAGVHEKQALVLVNHGSATGQEILDLARKIQAKVHDIYDIAIDTEVNLINL